MQTAERRAAPDALSTPVHQGGAGRCSPTSTVLPLTVVSDGLGCFTVAASLGAVHDRDHRRRQGLGVLNEKFLSRQHPDRQRQDGTDRHIPRDQVRQVRLPLPRRGQFRFNRRYNMRAMLGSLLRAVVAAPRRPECGIRLLRFIANQVFITCGNRSEVSSVEYYSGTLLPSTVVSVHPLLTTT